ncbi:hypothetical protein PDESU_05930 [Pontiella desulfatans]|uniref:Uncharacterized protein n=1 Tax=Pontiella desulfatans TaxID=2750659 RepID=A0A6C2UD80_PONDE|nr:hypothetical protein PDESU_05930 [Pontiella desulfatans]
MSKTGKMISHERTQGKQSHGSVFPLCSLRSFVAKAYPYLEWFNG